jgi:hypothetical protein
MIIEVTDSSIIEMVLNDLAIDFDATNSATPKVTTAHRFAFSCSRGELKMAICDTHQELGEWIKSVFDDFQNFSRFSSCEIYNNIKSALKVAT